jgi:AraC-like DNA-binding protein
MLDLVKCGGMRVSLNDGAPPHRCRHDEHALGLHIVRSGTNRYGSETIPIRGPFLALLPAGELDENGMTGDVDCRWCLFRSALVGGDGDSVQLRWAGATVQRPHARRLTSAEVRQARETMASLAAHHARPGVADRLLATARLVELLALWASPERQRGAADPVADFRARIEERADDATCSIEALARTSGLHPDWLRRRFILAYGLTPVEYRLRLRLTRARILLRTTAVAVAEVGRQVGFANPSHFTRLFRRHFGCRPSDLVRRGG